MLDGIRFQKTDSAPGECHPESSFRVIGNVVAGCILDPSSFFPRFHRVEAGLPVQGMETDAGNDQGAVRSALHIVDAVVISRNLFADIGFMVRIEQI